MDHSNNIYLPFQAVFAAIFIASIAIGFDTSDVGEPWWIVFVFRVVLVIVKLNGFGTVAAVFNRPLPVVLESGLALHQVGKCRAGGQVIYFGAG